MSEQCVTLQTSVGDILVEIDADAAPETARNFLNLSATGAYDETTFSRVVPKFVIQGGNLSTGQKWTLERAARANRTVRDEPNYIKHVRGVVSLARPDEPNKGTTHFFILVGDAPSLDGKFAAFGRVSRGMEVVDAINQAPVEGETPLNPVVIKHALVARCK
jgi:peptidyl-prolyl cis-trans isomerase B (cyclophilin B)